MSDELIATLIRTMERMEAKLDVVVEGQHAHDLRLQPLEADLGARKNRKRWVATVAATVTAALVLVFLGVHR